MCGTPVSPHLSLTINAHLKPYIAGPSESSWERDIVCLLHIFDTTVTAWLCVEKYIDLGTTICLLGRGHRLWTNTVVRACR